MLYKEQKILEETYKIIQFLESSDDTLKMIKDWQKKYLESSEDEKKVKNLFDDVIKLWANEKDNTLLMDKLTSYFITIGKYTDDDGAKELSNILKKIN